jgi:choline dehydrogenase-like flavoprotein
MQRAGAAESAAGRSRFDAIIIGSGFGGSMVARSLVDSGLDVLMLERGDWVPRGPHNWANDGTLDLTSFATTEPKYRVVAGGRSHLVAPYSCVGGPGVFYGGVSLRFREADFDPDPEIVGDSGAAWPYRYADLEPFYSQAEQLLDVAGECGSDPTEPFRSASYGQPTAELSDTSQMIGDAARSLGFHPFRLPLAINYRESTDRAACTSCMTCDTFACALGAKNDLATCVLPDLMGRGLRVEHNTVATRLVHERGRIVGLECFEKATGTRRRYSATQYFLSAGALGSAHLLLASELDRVNPAGGLIGRNLMRHCSAIAFGVFPRHPNKRKEFHKQIGIHDFYFGHRDVATPSGKLGSLQQLQTPPIGLVQDALPGPLGRLIGPIIDHTTGLLAMAEDQPQADNRVWVEWGARDTFGLPRLSIEHHYSRRDRAARAALTRPAKRVLRHAGAQFSYVHEVKTFSHALGTVRFGLDPCTSALDEWCCFRGAENLHVVDASFMPTAAGVNPSLTIAANALRVGEHVTRCAH